jgi:hypothetical protein
MLLLQDLDQAQDSDPDQDLHQDTDQNSYPDQHLDADQDSECSHPYVLKIIIHH